MFLDCYLQNSPSKGSNSNHMEVERESSFNYSRIDKFSVYFPLAMHSLIAVR